MNLKPGTWNLKLLLEVRDLTVAFGGLKALDGFSMSVCAGEIHALIGPNGSGKSTFLNAVTGLVAGRGQIVFNGAPLLGLPPYRVFRAGIARSFQTPRLFPSLTVAENILLGLHVECARKTARELEQAAQTQLARTGLAGRGALPVDRLTAAERRCLEIARAVAHSPLLLLLDEPAAGMSAAERQALAALLREIRASGTAILLIEHDLKMVADVADCVTALNFGKKIAEGAPAEVASHPAVVEAYLGKRQGLTTDEHG